MLISIALVVFRFCQDCDVGLLPEVGGLLDANAVALIAVFCFQNINSLVLIWIWATPIMHRLVSWGTTATI